MLSVKRSLCAHIFRTHARPTSPGGIPGISGHSQASLEDFQAIDASESVARIPA
jgi:hypothetical protein